MPWGKVQLKKKRNKLLWGIRSVTNCIVFTITQCKETACPAAPGKAAPLGWVVILQKSMLQRHPHSSSVFGHYEQTCFTADEHAFKENSKSFENYLNARVIMLEGCCRARSPPLHFLTTPLWSSLWDALGTITLLKRVSVPGLHCGTACWITARCFAHPRSPVPRPDSPLPVGMGKGWRKLNAGHGWS